MPESSKIYKVCPKCGNPINGNTKKLENHLYGDNGETQCKSQIPSFFNEEYLQKLEKRRKQRSKKYNSRK